MLEDVQASRDDRHLRIDEVGITGIRYPVAVADREHGKQDTIAEVSMSVDLPPGVKGAHLSRFVEVLHKTAGEITPQAIPAILDALRARLGASTARLEMSFPFFLRRCAPVTGAVALMDYRCWLAGALDCTGARITLGVQVPVTSVCPCSKAISDYGAHNQRATITIRARAADEEGLPAEIWAEDLIDVAEAAASCPVFPLLKRPDERHVTMHAHDHPVFVEDMARAAVEALGGDARIAWFSVEAASDESIHNHAAFARIQSHGNLRHPDMYDHGECRMTANGNPGRSPVTVHVIVTCTNRKKWPAAARLRLRSLPAGTTAQRADTWIRRLCEDANEPFVPARDLYAGEHWTIVRSLPDLSSDTENVRLWVCSAGYGLIPVDAQIRPYAATFSTGFPDSVADSLDEATHWWDVLRQWDGPCPPQHRSLFALTQADQAALFILALSEPYLRACRHDISAALEHIPDPDRFLIVSAARKQGSLAPVTVPADARLQAYFGGTRQALNARIAAHLLSAGIRSRSQATAHLTQLLEAQPPVPRYDRKKLSDDEVLDLIAERISQSPATSASALLRQIRDAGYACEQQRFAQLYRIAMEVPS